MKEHYDVGVVGCWWGANYGSVLNGYAVYKTLKSMGLSVLMIHKHNAKENDWEITNTHNARFIEKFYPSEDVSPIIRLNDLHKLNDVCGMFLTGSDQVWNYGINSIFDMVFMLNFADDSKKKISFGTSFGHESDGTPKDKLPEVTRLLQRYDAVSVREPSGVRICSSVYGIKADLVTEPVFCLTERQYCELAESSGLTVEEPYILTYILDPTPQKREAVKGYCALAGMKAVNVLDGDPRVYDKNYKALNLPDTMGKIGAEDLIGLYKNASFVITDSFHGTAFALIFNKPFLAITNVRRGSVRFYELLSKYGLTGRLAENPEKIPVNESFLREIDYAPVNQTIRQERERSIEWLKWALETPKEEMPSILLPAKNIQNRLDMKMCTGCSACVNICPCGALELKPDEYGYYRSSVDYKKCVGCGLCAKICPALNLPERKNSADPDCYAFIAADDKVLESSSSGGVFSLLAGEAFRRNGAVAGAAWREDLYVEHIIIDDEKDLPKLRKSKYLQSYLGTTDSEIKKRLDAGQFVLFSGCPCQAAGLKAYLGKEYDNLILVDLLCASAPSAGFFHKYLESSFPGGVKDYQFRYKKQGWNSDCVTLTLTLADGTKIVRRGENQDDYQKLFHPHTMTPPHCEHCKYQSVPRYGDITIGDFWWYQTHDSAADVSRGISVVLCNNEKGQAFFDSLPESEIKVKKKVPRSWIRGNGSDSSWHNFISPYRDKFYESIKSKSFSEALNIALYDGKTIDDYKNEARWNQNAMNFCSELCFDHMGERKFDRFTQGLAGKKIAVLKFQDRAGQIFLRACENAGAKVVFKSAKAALNQLSGEEFEECKKADVVITCCVHGTKTHGREGVKCIDIWDILH